jgi:hypothetical protein
MSPCVGHTIPPNGSSGMSELMLEFQKRARLQNNYQEIFTKQNTNVYSEF